MRKTLSDILDDLNKFEGIAEADTAYDYVDRAYCECLRSEKEEYLEKAIEALDEYVDGEYWDDLDEIKYDIKYYLEYKL